MSIIVKKFGGSSVESIEKLQRIAEHISDVRNDSDQLVIVVSAMGKTTDQLFNLAYQITTTPNQREMDMLVSAGERITMALLSLVLEQKNIASISFTGSQSGIITDTLHGNAKILTVNAYRLFNEFKKGKVVIVAGYQGVSLEKEITTLGRGGSDTTAVALACFLQAQICEIFTDVEGVFTADPRLVPTARKLPHLSYQEMLFMALTGSKVLHHRAAEYAYKYQIPLEIKSVGTPLMMSETVKTAFMPSASKSQLTGGTMIDNEETTSDTTNAMERSIVKAISHKENLLRYDIPLSDSAIPIFKTDIFDMGITDTHLQIWIEQRNETIFINELKEANKAFTKADTVFAIVNLMGHRICKDTQFFLNLYKSLKKHCQYPFTIQNNGIGIQLIVQQTEVADIILYLHNKYIESEDI